MAATTVPAIALEENPDEKNILKTCEKNLCAMILSKETSRDDLSCAISITWAKNNVEMGTSTKSLSWGFGDARCTLDLTGALGVIVSSLTQPEHERR